MTKKTKSKIIPYAYLVLIGMTVLYHIFTRDDVGAIYHLIFVIAMIQVTKLGFILDDHLKSKK